MTDFWKNWLHVACWAVVLFGAVLAGGAFEATDGPVRLLFGFFNAEAASTFDATTRFSTGLMGALSIGWGLTMFSVVQAALLLGADAAPVWRKMMVALVVWYAVDAVISVATGFALNVVSNTVLAAAFLYPVIVTGALKDRGSRAVPA